ncbi:hypothetical protein HIR68_03855 [Staphylococcus coagulans]|uniref:hypothetical protein n=1 Tax=Staphylococcus coagulans TaxID=74706 RepID=UPI001BE6E69B|nr:hypothetical protein [Staphylococcus coagulans]MBT2830961.1 hypothetical protein [Staphylococcus coagulans]MBT2859515.1 hypothetical protein [Staphylococcus coagulans]MBU3873023.1 hypothetical protein [Staphylococcus coagulans]UNB48643.1 hypothetical protein KM149_00460 [Staphylococcus coagulans]
MIEFYSNKIVGIFEKNKDVMKYLKINYEENFACLSYIYCVENMHRGSNTLKLVEYLLVKYFHSYSTNKDFSLGPFQLKYSFCVSNNLILDSLEDLLTVSISSNLVNKFIEKHKGCLTNEEILILFHAGDKNDTSFSSFMYKELYKKYCKFLSMNQTGLFD